MTLKTADNMIFFEAYKGMSYSCSPRAIYEYMVEHPDFQNFQFVWAFKKPKRFKSLTRRYSNTLVIKQYGKVYESALAMSKYWITNYRLMQHLNPKENQVYVQCWHGTPMKSLGFNQSFSKSPIHSLAERKKKYLHDAHRLTYLLSPSPYATRHFVSAWGLDSMGKTGAIIEEGYPRNDALFHFDETRLERVRKKLGIPLDDKRKIILYAPTWRDDQYQAGKGYVYNFMLDIEKMKQQLGEEYILLCRLHYLVSNKLNLKCYNGFAIDVSRHNDINELYVLSDLLVTDYSSVCFDYANLKKPMIFFMYDLESYRHEVRGLDMEIDDLPGEVVTDEDALIQTILRIDLNRQPDERYHRFRQTYNPLDDGKATERVVGIIFDHNSK